MTWAAELAWKAGQAMADAVVDQVPDSDRGVSCDKLLGIIRRRRIGEGSRHPAIHPWPSAVGRD